MELSHFSLKLLLLKSLFTARGKETQTALKLDSPSKFSDFPAPARQFSSSPSSIKDYINSLTPPFLEAHSDVVA